MYKSISIKNFRGFEDMKIEPFKKINLITGLNNAGKTSLLEALFLLGVPNNPEGLLVISRLREITVFPRDADALWGDLFFEKKYEDNKITISSRGEGNKRQSLVIYMSEEKYSDVFLGGEKQEVLFATTEKALLNKIEFKFIDHTGREFHSYGKITPSNKEPVYERAKITEEMRAQFLSSRHKWLQKDADRFSKFVLRKKEDKIIKILKHIEPRLKNLSVVSRGGASILYGDVGLKALVPLPMMGGGINRLLSLALVISDTENGIVLIDEIDSGFHYSEMVNVWKSIQVLADEYNVQVFLTTHSIECIRAAYQVFSKTKNNDFTLHRLDIKDSKISSVYYDKETLEAAIETGLEIR